MPRRNARASASEQAVSRTTGRASASEQVPLRRNERASTSEQGLLRRNARASASEQRPLKQYTRASASEQRPLKQRTRASASEQLVGLQKKARVNALASSLLASNIFRRVNLLVGTTLVGGAMGPELTVVTKSPEKQHSMGGGAWPGKVGAS